MNSESSKLYEKQRNGILPTAGYSGMMAVMVTVAVAVMALLLVQKCCKTIEKTAFSAPWSKTNNKTNENSTVSRGESQQRPRESPERLQRVPREPPQRLPSVSREPPDREFQLAGIQRVP